HLARAASFFAALVAETNSKRASGANEIAFGTHGFEFADGLTDFDRADLRPVERDHFSEVASSNEFRRRRAEHRAERAIKRGWRSAALKVAEHAHARFFARALLDAGATDCAYPP